MKLPQTLKHIALTAAVASCLTSCANGDMGAMGSILGAIGSQMTNVPTSMLQANLNQAFPATTKVMQMIDVKVENPVVRPLPQSNQLEAGLDLSVAKSLLGNALGGSLRVASGLRFEPKDASIRLANPAVTQISFAALPAQYNSAINQVGNFVVGQVLKDYPVYKVPGGASQIASALMSVAQIQVTPSGLTLGFAPTTMRTTPQAQQPMPAR